MGDATTDNGSSSAVKSDNSDTERQLAIASQDDDGIWRDSEGNPLPVSASDLERHAYCPLSWDLARSGVSGSGKAIQLGQKKHKEIENAMRDYRKRDTQARKEMVIWSWWFAVVVTLTLDTIVLFFVRNAMIAPDDVIFSDEELIIFARYLVLLALVWLCCAMVLLLLPWRKMLGSPFGFAQPPRPSEFDIEEIGLFYFESDDLDKGGWGVGGKIEFAVILGSLTIALHGFTLYYAIISPKLTSSILIIATIFWTLFAAGQLQRVLRASSDVEKHGDKLGIETGTSIVYNDDSKTSELLHDSKTGLRGRPDQIIIIENEIIPVEQKTGKIPKYPHFSHKLQLYAYLHLVSEITNNKTSYGILRYGDEDLHKIDWDEDSRAELMEHLKEVQRLMVEGGAERNHSRVGKCNSCSRKHRCPMPLT
jgi:CRISPR-associated exonuclease Cas4